MRRPGARMSGSALSAARVAPRLRAALGARELEAEELAEHVLDARRLAAPADLAEAARDRQRRPPERCRQRARLALDDEVRVELRERGPRRLQLARVVEARDHGVPALAQVPERLERAGVVHPGIVVLRGFWLAGLQPRLEQLPDALAGDPPLGPPRSGEHKSALQSP